jgi:exonuclease VII large subunit
MDLIARTENLLKRQAAWLRSAIADYESMPKDFDEAAYETLLDRLRLHNKAIEDFRKERAILEKEWQRNESIAAPSALRSLSDEVSGLTTKLQTIQTDASARTAAASEAVQKELNGLQRGRNVLEGYRSGGGDGSQWIDRKG